MTYPSKSRARSVGDAAGVEAEDDAVGVQFGGELGGKIAHVLSGHTAGDAHHRGASFALSVSRGGATGTSRALTYKINKILISNLNNKKFEITDSTKIP